MSQASSILADVRANCRGALIAVGIVSLFVNMLMLTVPLYMLQIFDRVLMSRSDETLLYLTLAAVGALIVLSALDVMRSRILVRVSTWFESRLGPEALARAVSGLVASQTYGAQALRDISQIRQFIASPGIFSLFDAPWVPIYLLVIYFLINGVWVAGDDLPTEGWSSLAYPTLEQCQTSAARGMELQEQLKAVNPRAYDKRFECEPRAEGSEG